MQISYRAYDSDHWSSTSIQFSSITKQINTNIHNAITEVSKGTIIMGDFNHGNIKWDTLQSTGV